MDSYQFNQDVGYFLHEHNEPRRLLVVGGVCPNKANDMEQGWKAPIKLWKLALFQRFNLSTQRLQVHAK